MFRLNKCLNNVCWIINQHIKFLKSYKMCVIEQSKMYDSIFSINVRSNEYSQELHY